MYASDGAQYLTFTRSVLEVDFEDEGVLFAVPMKTQRFFRRKFAFLQIYDRVWQSFGQETTEHPREDDIHLEGGNPPSSKSLDSDFDTESASSASL